MKTKKVIEIKTEDSDNLFGENDIINCDVISNDIDTITWDDNDNNNNLRITSKVPYVPIDNSNHIYVPVYLSCGVIVQCQLSTIPDSPKVCKSCNIMR